MKATFTAASVQSGLPVEYYSLMMTTSTAFTWQGNHGFAFASDLSIVPGRWPTHIAVRSARTGRELTFRCLRPELNAEGELVGVRYIAARTVVDDVYLTIGND